MFFVRFFSWLYFLSSRFGFFVRTKRVGNIFSFRSIPEKNLAPFLISFTPCILFLVIGNCLRMFPVGRRFRRMYKKNQSNQRLSVKVIRF